MSQPVSIDKRTFKCNSCHYSAQVYGEMYFDHGSHEYIATFHCQTCKRLYENFISKIDEGKIMKGVYHDLADDFTCFYCGKNNSKVWNKKDGLCPKCNGEMEFEVKGTIRVKHN